MPNPKPRKASEKILLFDWPNILSRIQPEKTLGGLICLVLGIFLSTYGLVNYGLCSYCWKHGDLKRGLIIEKHTSSNRGGISYLVKIQYPIHADYKSDILANLSSEMYDSIAVSDAIEFKTLDLLKNTIVADPRTIIYNIQFAAFSMIFVVIGIFDVRNRMKIQKAN